MEIIKKPEKFTDKNDRQKRKSKITKNQLVQENLNQIVKNHVKFCKLTLVKVTNVSNRVIF